VTVSESDPRLDREVHVVADVDEITGDVHCPLCGSTLGRESVATPDVPLGLLSDASVDIVARAYVCERHRVDVVAFEPASLAPDPFVPVDAVVDGREVRLAVPRPVAEREGVLSK